MLKPFHHYVKLILGAVALLNSKALTKIQSIILITAIAVAAVGVAAIVLWNGPKQSSDTIKIGFLNDLDGSGKQGWQGITLAAEQINAEGGLLGKQIELICEDIDPYDVNVFSTGLNRLISFHEVDFIFGYSSAQLGFLVQEIITQNKIIYIGGGTIPEAVTQRVLDEYEKYKYYFHPAFNATCGKLGVTDSLIHIREITGFNKIGYLAEDLGWTQEFLEQMDVSLPENGFELVYKGVFPPFDTLDFSSYYAAAEAAGVEVLVPMIALDTGIPFAKEYYDRQSPMIIFGGICLEVSDSDGWEVTDGKCNHMDFGESPTSAGYPFTTKTLPTREAYFERWGESITLGAAYWYDALRFIFTDSIERAGTIETEAVIKALETVSVETSNARNFVFTESHALMMGTDANDPNADYPIIIGFQWQDGVQVPVDPRKIMEEAGATITFPDWPGPWDNIT